MADDLQRKIIAKVYSRVAAVFSHICDEGDRVYFGSTNDADILRGLSAEWDHHRIMGEDILSSEQEVAELKNRVTALEDHARALAEALQASEEYMAFGATDNSQPYPLAKARAVLEQHQKIIGGK